MADATSRKIIAALEVSLVGLVEGPNGEVDWIGSREDSFDLLPEIDTLMLGGGAYPGYQHYWLAILANPHGVLPLTGRVPSGMTRGGMRLRTRVSSWAVVVAATTSLIAAAAYYTLLGGAWLRLRGLDPNTARLTPELWPMLGQLARNLVVATALAYLLFDSLMSVGLPGQGE